jgi:hypothetical protein
MKFTNILLAVTATASVVIANPIVETTSPNAANVNVFARDDCQKCTDFVDKCKRVSLCRLLIPRDQILT